MYTAFVQIQNTRYPLAVAVKVLINMLRKMLTRGASVHEYSFNLISPKLLGIKFRN